MMRIDVHNHILSQDVFERIESHSSYKIKRDSDGNVLTIIGNKMPVIDIADRIVEMDAYKIDKQVISFLTFIFFTEEALRENPSKRNKLSKVINNYMAEVCQQDRDRFMALADISLIDVSLAIDEVRRCIQELGLHGVSLGSHVHGVPLSSKHFWPFFDEVNKLGVPIYIHPIIPRDRELFQEYHLAAMVGFPFETTLAATRMVYSGLFETFQELRLILCHAGGAIPFLWERLNRGYLNQWAECRENIGKPATEYFKNFYYDTALTFPDALSFAFKVVGDHIMFGTDYPYTTPAMDYRDDIAENIKMVENLEISDEEKTKIFGSNAQKVFGPQKE